jgi:hypothetical protein
MKVPSFLVRMPDLAVDPEVDLVGINGFTNSDGVGKRCQPAMG